MVLAVLVIVAASVGLLVLTAARGHLPGVGDANQCDRPIAERSGAWVCYEQEPSQGPAGR